jgi:hypothetical protein
VRETKFEAGRLVEAINDVVGKDEVCGAQGHA